MEEKFKSAIDYGLKRNRFSGLKPNQSVIIEAYLKGHHKFDFSKGHIAKSFFFFFFFFFFISLNHYEFLLSQN